MRMQRDLFVLLRQGIKKIGEGVVGAVPDQVKHRLLSDYLCQQLKSFSIKMVFA